MFTDQSVRHEILPHADDVAFHVSLHVTVCTLLDTLTINLFHLLYTLIS